MKYLDEMMYGSHANREIRKLPAEATRIVIKIGTATIAHPTGQLNIRRMERFVKVLADLKNAGKEIIVVSSGAIGMGVGKLGLAKKPADLAGKQACAAIGQCELMYLYDKYFAEYNHLTAQVLLTLDAIELEHRRSYITNTFQKLLEYKVIPIVNENDTVAVDEIVVGDNDTLSAIVCELVDGDLLIILSDIDGLYEDDPRTNPNAKRIPYLPDITEEELAMAKGEGSSLGTGGMITKLKAAKHGLLHGFSTIIMHGEEPELLYDVLEGKDIGTRIG